MRPAWNAMGAMLACGWLAGCAGLTADPTAESRFSVSQDASTFSFVTPARNDDALENGEPERAKALGLELLKTHACPNGYDITGRKIERRPTGGYLIYYAGRCR